MSTVAPSVNLTSRWYVIYPNYIDGSKKISQGRRVPQAVAVESPTLAEISAALGDVQHQPEPSKAYPRDWLVEGRVRVDPAAVTNKQQLLVAVAQAVKAARQAKATPSPAGAATKKKKK